MINYHYSLRNDPAISGNLEYGTISCPETSVRNYRYSMGNNPANRDSNLLPGSSLKSRTGSKKSDVLYPISTLLLKCISNYYGAWGGVVVKAQYY